MANQFIKTCSYVLGRLPNTYRCDAPVKWTVEEQEDGSRVRDYKTWCPEHEVKIQLREEETK